MSQVSRSVYQKKCEENKKLRRDIEILVRGAFVDKLPLQDKWEQEFKRRDKCNSFILSIFNPKDK